MDNMRRLEEIFGHFPGIGPRQARRFVYYLLNKSPSFISEFTKLVDEVRKSVSECSLCHRIFPSFGPQSGNLPSLCSICSDKSRDSSLLVIVARDSDMESIERSGAYKGLYFILGGTVPILDKEPEKRIRLNDLLKRASSREITEIILSLSTTPEGENTALIVRKRLQNKLEASADKPRITILGRGLSTGAELEYVDGDTIKNALKHRE